MPSTAVDLIQPTPASGPTPATQPDPAQPTPASGPTPATQPDPAQPTPADRPELSIDLLVDSTPDTRDRYVDFLRALSILVVVLWHWVFSITQWNEDGSLGMPNPVGGVPGLWMLTWVLQIMPVFFFVGGFSNLAAYEAVERRAGGCGDFFRGRLRRLLKPVAIYAAIWTVGELVARATFPAYRGVLHWGSVVFVPLWFLGVYFSAVLVAPVMIRLHRHASVLTMVSLASAIGICEVARIRGGEEWIALVSSAVVWLFIHQLGFFWRDGTLTRSGHEAWALLVGGLAALVILTNLGTYPQSMVSLQGEASNLLPTTACIAALAVFQLGLVLLIRPVATRWLQRRTPWKLTVSLNAVAMTVFCWHMTALVIAIGLYTLLGGSLRTAADHRWWLERPLWLILPGIVLAALLMVFARFELPGRPGRIERTTS